MLWSHAEFTILVNAYAMHLYMKQFIYIYEEQICIIKNGKLIDLDEMFHEHNSKSEAPRPQFCAFDDDKKKHTQATCHEDGGEGLHFRPSGGYRWTFPQVCASEWVGERAEAPSLAWKDYLEKSDKHLVCDRMLMEGPPAHTHTNTWCDTQSHTPGIVGLFSHRPCVYLRVCVCEPSLKAGNNRSPSSNRACRFSGVSACSASTAWLLHSVHVCVFVCVCGGHTRKREFKVISLVFSSYII